MELFKLIRGVVLAALAIFIFSAINEITSGAPAASTADVATPPPPPAKSVDMWPYLVDGAQGAQTVEEMMRVNYYLVVDGSGSMGGRHCSAGDTKLNAAKKAVGDFGAAVPPNANLGLTTFSRDGVQEKLALGLGNRPQFTAQINAIDAGGGTPLRSAMKVAFDHLTNQARKQLGYGEYHLVVVTDGEANTGEDPTTMVNQILTTSPVVIHTIGFCIDKNHSLNQVGRTYYQSATDPASLAKGLSNVLAEAPQFTDTQFQ